MMIVNIFPSSGVGHWHVQRDWLLHRPQPTAGPLPQQELQQQEGLDQFLRGEIREFRILIWIWSDRFLLPKKSSDPVLDPTKIPGSQYCQIQLFFLRVNPIRNLKKHKRKNVFSLLLQYVYKCLFLSQCIKKNSLVRRIEKIVIVKALKEFTYIMQISVSVEYFFVS